MDFEWDEAKAATNLAKHGVGFVIVYALDWAGAVARADNRRNYGELRLRTLLVGPDGSPYMVVHTPRQNRHRIISVRRAHQKEYRKWVGL